MNLNSLFTPQRELDDEIIKNKGLEGQDLFKKKIVALICELYECANEARFFKFWSSNQKPNRGYKTPIECGFCEGAGRDFNDDDCPECEGKGVSNEYSSTKDYLLEEYVDVIHFMLSIANDLNYTSHDYVQTRPRDLSDLVIGITNAITVLAVNPNRDLMQSIFNNIITLGYQLGFTEEEVIEAYHNKNKVNHERQENGY